MVAIPQAGVLDIAVGATRPSWKHRIGWYVRRQPLGVLSASLLLAMVVVALLAPALAPHDPVKVDASVRLHRPDAAFLLGTDDFGRDVLSRIIFGARLSLGVGFTSVALSAMLGTLFGLVSAYWVGPIDTFLQRLIDILMAFPSLLLALILIAVSGASTTNVILAIGITQAPAMARVIRSATLVVRSQQYIEAARSTGAGHLRLIMRHIFPNVTAVIIVYASINIGYAILTEASLSFLGLGVPPPAPSWGGMLSASNESYLLQAPWLAIAPGVAISLAVLALNMLGDSCRDILDPRMRRGRL